MAVDGVENGYGFFDIGSLIQVYSPLIVYVVKLLNILNHQGVLVNHNLFGIPIVYIVYIVYIVTYKVKIERFRYENPNFKSLQAADL